MHDAHLVSRRFGLAIIIGVVSLVLAEGVAAQATGCSASAHAASIACHFSAKDDRFAARAICMDDPSEDLPGCLESSREEYDEVLNECADIFEAQLEVCDLTDDAAHVPDFGPEFADNFVHPLTIGAGVEPNPWFPLKQGNEWIYEGTFEEDGERVTETITVTVLDETKLIDGITCLVVRDTVVVDDELIEDTDDWFAEDVDGNVWYCGEEAKDFETYDDDMPPIPELVAIDGSFKAGRDGDEAGILLPADLVVGDFFRQEVSFANAEDVIEILALGVTEPIAFAQASCTADCLQTRDYTALEPGVAELKFYKPGIGRVLELDPETGDRSELVSVTMAP